MNYNTYKLIKSLSEKDFNNYKNEKFYTYATTGGVHFGYNGSGNPCVKDWGKPWKVFNNYNDAFNEFKRLLS